MFSSEQSADCRLADEERHLESLRRVIPVECKANYNPERGCMQGTRVGILKEISEWVVNPNSPERLLWLHGPTGSGKSAIASSVCHQLHMRTDGRQYLAASFFCKRDDQYLRNPTLILPKVAMDVADVFPAFAKAVATLLSNDRSLAKTEALRPQFTGLIKGPVTELAWGNREPLVIVVDALDEIGTAEDRRQLIAIFHEMSGLTPWLKVILTSRPDPDIRRFFNRPGQTFRDLDLNMRSSLSDILTATRVRMRDIANDNNLGSDWPGEAKIFALAERAMPLFIWVEVATSFIKGSMQPDDRLDRVLKADFTGGAYQQLDSLYTTAIVNFFGDGVDNAEYFRDIMGIIVVVSLHTPLPLPALLALKLQANGNSQERTIDGGVAKRTIDALASVLYEDRNNDGAIRLCHPSFMDFLIQPDRLCPPRFHIDIQYENTRVAAMCLRTMLDSKHGLKFNICDLDSSHHLNANIDGLDDRVEVAISDPLHYSCLHWAAHLADSSTGEDEHKDLYELLKNFFNGSHPLFWLEALSLLGEVRTAIKTLPLVVAWINVSYQI